MNSNRSRRFISLGLIGAALLLILRFPNVLPFVNQTNNQVSANVPPADRPPIADLDASRTGTSTQNPLLPGGNSSGGGSTTDPSNPGTLTPPTGTGQTNPPLRAGW